MNDYSHTEIVGLVPAGGKGKRIAPLPCSKEIYPIGFHKSHEELGSRPKVISHYLLEKMRLAGITKAYIILRKGKWDIPSYFGDGKILDMHLAYLMMDLPFGVPYTLDQAYPFIKDSTVAFGFPDILFKPNDVFKKLLSKQAESSAEIVLGLFPAHQPHKMDMVKLNNSNRVWKIEIKPVHTNLNYTWINAVWTPKFTHYMHEYVSANIEMIDADEADYSVAKRHELFVGDVIQAAINDNLKVDKVIFTNGKYFDIGTPEDMINAVHMTYKGWINANNHC